MNYKVIVYSLTYILSLFALSGLNFDSFMKKNKPLEARILVLILALAFSYLTTNFILDIFS